MNNVLNRFVRKGVRKQAQLLKSSGIRPSIPGDLFDARDCIVFFTSFSEKIESKIWFSWNSKSELIFPCCWFSSFPKISEKWSKKLPADRESDSDLFFLTNLFIFFQKDFGFDLASFDIFKPSLRLNFAFAFRFILLNFVLHLMKFVLFCSDRLWENWRFALLNSLLEDRHSLSNHLFSLIGLELFSAHMLVPKWASEQL